MAEPFGTRMERAADWMVGLFSPQRAAVRAFHRRMTRDATFSSAMHLMWRQRGYKAAETGKNDTPWLNLSNRTADLELSPSRWQLVARSRAANRDDAIGTGVTKGLTRKVVGRGRHPQARCVLPDGKPDDRKNDALEAYWWQRYNKLSPADAGICHADRQAMLYRKRLEDGEVWSNPVFSAVEPVWFETIESDRVSTPLDAKPRDAEGRISDGVEKDRLGRTVAYWVSKTHPGDGLTSSMVGKTPSLSLSARDYVRLPVDRCFHLKRGIDRPGQSRGVVLFHACLQDLLDLDLLFVAALKRCQLAACLAAFIKSGESSMQLLEMTAQDYGYQLDQQITPGMMFRLYPGEELAPFTPTLDVPELWPLIMVCARRIGSSCEVSPQFVLRAWEGISYSGARTIVVEDRETFRKEGAALDEELAWEWTLVQTDGVLHGDQGLQAAGVTVEDCEYVEWIGNAEEWVDPRADSEATKVALDIGTTTLADECAKQGKDWKENLRKKAEAEAFLLAARRDLGVPDDGVPMPGSTAAQAQAEAANAAADAATAADDAAAATAAKAWQKGLAA